MPDAPRGPNHTDAENFYQIFGIHLRTNQDPTVPEHNLFAVLGLDESLGDSEIRRRVEDARKERGAKARGYQAGPYRDLANPLSRMITRASNTLASPSGIQQHRDELYAMRLPLLEAAAKDAADAAVPESQARESLNKTAERLGMARPEDRKKAVAAAMQNQRWAAGGGAKPPPQPDSRTELTTVANELSSGGATEEAARNTLNQMAARLGLTSPTARRQAVAKAMTGKTWKSPPTAPSGPATPPKADPRDELDAIAKELSRAGVTQVVARAALTQTADRLGVTGSFERKRLVDRVLRGVDWRPRWSPLELRRGDFWLALHPALLVSAVLLLGLYLWWGWIAGAVAGVLVIGAAVWLYREGTLSSPGLVASLAGPALGIALALIIARPAAEDVEPVIVDPPPALVEHTVEGSGEPGDASAGDASAEDPAAGEPAPPVLPTLPNLHPSTPVTIPVRAATVGPVQVRLPDGGEPRALANLWDGDVGTAWQPGQPGAPGWFEVVLPTATRIDGIGVLVLGDSEEDAVFLSGFSADETVFDVARRAGAGWQVLPFPARQVETVRVTASVLKGEPRLAELWLYQAHEGDVAPWRGTLAFDFGDLALAVNDEAPTWMSGTLPGGFGSPDSQYIGKLGPDGHLIGTWSLADFRPDADESRWGRFEFQLGEDGTITARHYNGLQTPLELDPAPERRE